MPWETEKLVLRLLVDIFSMVTLALRFIFVTMLASLVRAPRCSRLTNQIGYITLVAQLPGIYGDVNRPCPRAAPSDSVGLLP